MSSSQAVSNPTANSLQDEFVLDGEHDDNIQLQYMLQKEKRAEQRAHKKKDKNQHANVRHVSPGASYMQPAGICSYDVKLIELKEELQKMEEKRAEDLLKSMETRFLRCFDERFWQLRSYIEATRCKCTDAQYYTVSSPETDEDSVASWDTIEDNTWAIKYCRRPPNAAKDSKSDSTDSETETCSLQKEGATSTNPSQNNITVLENQAKPIIREDYESVPGKSFPEHAASDLASHQSIEALYQVEMRGRANIENWCVSVAQLPDKSEDNTHEQKADKNVLIGATFIPVYADWKASLSPPTLHQDSRSLSQTVQRMGLDEAQQTGDVRFQDPSLPTATGPHDNSRSSGMHESSHAITPQPLNEFQSSIWNFGEQGTHYPRPEFMPQDQNTDATRRRESGRGHANGQTGLLSRDCRKLEELLREVDRRAYQLLLHQKYEDTPLYTKGEDTPLRTKGEDHTSDARTSTSGSMEGDTDSWSGKEPCTID
ncbi:hypothetical protein BDZ91DRAFT_796307 [Kalaharituber pfeilii]|nr:hypothetical protein BDZ91DRAFT_796307 [Kalaharituber pfeilii]